MRKKFIGMKIQAWDKRNKEKITINLSFRNVADIQNVPIKPWKSSKSIKLVHLQTLKSQAKWTLLVMRGVDQNLAWWKALKANRFQKEWTNFKWWIKHRINFQQDQNSMMFLSLTKVVVLLSPSMKNLIIMSATPLLNQDSLPLTQECMENHKVLLENSD